MNPSFRSSSLSGMMISPVLAGLHFTICYITTGFFCARNPSLAEITTARVSLVALTCIVLATMAWLTWRAWHDANRSRLIGKAFSADTQVTRKDFLRHTTFLLGVLSIVGVCFVAAPLLFVDHCV